MTPTTQRSRRSSARRRRRTTDELIADLRVPRTSPTARKMRLPRRGEDRRRSSKARRTRSARRSSSTFLLQDENLHAVCRRSRSAGWYPGDQGGRGPAAFWQADPHRTGGVQPVRRRHGDVRVHQELQVHDPQQRERLGEGHEPRGQRQSGPSTRRSDEMIARIKQVALVRRISRTDRWARRGRPTVRDRSFPQVSTLALPTCEPVAAEPARRRSGLSPWQKRGADRCSPSTSWSSWSSCSTRSCYGLWLARHPVSYVKLCRRSDRSLTFGRQHARRSLIVGDQPQDGRRR